jgi:ribonucleoside-diphosphate reductase subunit M1
VKTQIIAANGSIQNIKEIPLDIKLLYKTVWEISQKIIINLAADRAPFIDQSQSLNIHLSDPNYSKISSMHFYAWKQGLKTGMYYLRSRAAVDAIKFTLNVEELLQASDGNDINKILKCLNKTSENSTKPNSQRGSKVQEEEEGCISCSG